MRVLNMWNKNLLALFVVLTAGCSDDTFIATNDIDIDAGSEASAGGSSGAAGAGGESGVAGMAGMAGIAGMAGAAGGGGTTACSPGQTQDTGTCAKCGTMQQTCDQSGAWGPDQCVGQGACEPGATTGGCSDPCQEKVCKNDCTWSACQLKGGAKCLYESGTNFQCCGTDKWQFCNATTCDWYSCQSCNGSSGCLNSC